MAVVVKYLSLLLYLSKFLIHAAAAPIIEVAALIEGTDVDVYTSF